MSSDTLYLIILVVSMLLAFSAAVGAVLAGIWLAGRLTGVLGGPVVVTEQPDIAAVTGVDGRERDNEPSNEDVPWLDEQGNAIPEDPGKDMDAWMEAKD